MSQEKVLGDQVGNNFAWLGPWGPLKIDTVIVICF